MKNAKILKEISVKVVNRIINWTINEFNHLAYRNGNNSESNDITKPPKFNYVCNINGQLVEIEYLVKMYSDINLIVSLLESNVANQSNDDENNDNDSKLNPTGSVSADSSDDSDMENIPNIKTLQSLSSSNNTSSSSLFTTQSNQMNYGNKKQNKGKKKKGVLLTNITKTMFAYNDPLFIQSTFHLENLAGKRCLYGCMLVILDCVQRIWRKPID